MHDEQLWKTVRARIHKKQKPVGSGAVNVAMLFGVAVMGVAVLATLALDKVGSDLYLAKGEPMFDNIITGSISENREEETRTYVIRRSITQETPGAVCIFDGTSFPDDC